MEGFACTYKYHNDKISIVDIKRRYYLPEISISDNYLEKIGDVCILRQSKMNELSSTIACSNHMSVERLRIAASNEQNSMHMIGLLCTDIYNMSEEYIVVIENKNKSEEY